MFFVVLLDQPSLSSPIVVFLFYFFILPFYCNEDFHCVTLLFTYLGTFLYLSFQHPLFIAIVIQLTRFSVNKPAFTFNEILKDTAVS